MKDLHVIFLPLGRGQFAQIDSDCPVDVWTSKWHAAIRGRVIYAATNATLKNGLKRSAYLHRVLMPDSLMVDHIDGNGLNNQRANLRPASKLLNGRAKNHKRAGATSIFRGVSLWKGDGRWHSEIMVSGKKFRFGPFDIEEDAARAYDAAARKYFGEYAAPNFP